MVQCFSTIGLEANRQLPDAGRGDRKARWLANLTQRTREFASSRIGDRGLRRPNTVPDDDEIGQAFSGRAEQRVLAQPHRVAAVWAATYQGQALRASFKNRPQLYVQPEEKLRADDRKNTAPR
jgi:hypothetical protein